MNAEVIKEFLVGLGFKVDDAGLAKFTSSIKGAAIGVTALGAAVTAAATAVTAEVTKIAGEMYELDKLAKRFRATAGSVDEFIDANELLGISQDVSVSSMKNLDRAIMDTSMGMGRAKKVFESLGISIKDASGKIKPTADVMAELQQKFKGMEYGKQLRVMERLGLDPALVKYFNADVEALSKDMADIDKAAGFDLEKSIAESKEYTKTWREAKVEINKWKMLMTKSIESIAVKLMPKMRAQIKSVTDSMVAIRRKIMENLPKAINAVIPVIGMIMRIATAFITVTGRIATGAATIIGWILKISNITHGWVGYIAAAMLAWKYLNLAFLKSPLGLLIALGAAVALLIDDYMTWKEGGESLIDWGGRFGTAMKVVTGVLAGIAFAIASAKIATLAYAIANGIATAATNTWAIAQGIATGVMNAARIAMWLFNAALAANPIGAVVVAIALLIGAGILLVKNWDTVKAWFMSFFDWLLAGFNKIAAWGGKIAGFAKSVAGFGQGANGVAGLGQDINQRPSLAPGPNSAARNHTSSQNVSQNTIINVNGASDPAATAKNVAKEQGRVNSDMTRNMRGATR